MMASAAPAPTTLREAKDEVMSAVALEDCSRMVAPRPPKKALKRLPIALPRKLRSWLPNARNTPVRTMRRPHRSSAAAPKSWIRKTMATIELYAPPDRFGRAVS